MSRRTTGRLFELKDLDKPLLPDLSWNDQADIAEVVSKAFSDLGCKCNGTSVDKIVDLKWGADIGEFIARAVPHDWEINGVIKPDVFLDLSTLSAEIDGNDEIMVWTYKEA